MEQISPTPGMRRLSTQEIRDVYRAGEEAVVALVQALQDRIAQLETLVPRVQALQTRVEELEARLGQNSSNSHKPPASDGLAKPRPRSLRHKSGRKPGGQPGHLGRTLPMVKDPKHIVPHQLDRCPCGRCGGVGLGQEPVLDYERRQVFDLPADLALEVTEHRAEVKRCPISGLRVVAVFPANVPAPVQYGPRFTGLMVYLNQEQLLPSERLCRLCEDLFGQPLSEATLYKATQQVAGRLGAHERAVIEQLVRAALLHLDESGVRVAGRLHWLHVASTARLTFYGVHAKRGTQALEAFDIVPRCRDTWLMHDHWRPYFTYTDCLHALCGQHLLRELKFLAEEHGQTWAAKLAAYLQHLHRRRQQAGVLDQPRFAAVRARYRALVRTGRAQRSLPRKAANLLTRLENFDWNYLAFLWAQEVPFTNNQAEQDIRMIKVRQKISGCFRTLKGAQIFARIRGYLSTCRKHGLNLWWAIEQAVTGHPFIPPPLSPAPA